MKWQKWLRWGLLSLVGLLVVIQLILYGRAHSNPPVIEEPPWGSAATRELAVRACFDCHSNETVWRWYANIAPISWLVTRDVDDGRERLNFSQWGSDRQETRDLDRAVTGGGMPPVYYAWVHASARLSDTEKQQLVQGLRATMTGG